MATKSIQGNENLARFIRSRRAELGLTIEEAARSAGVGTKTWSRYEAGESIRLDKCKGVCRTLGWSSLPGEESRGNFKVQELKKHEAWSKYLEDKFGERAALEFAIGSDILLDRINDDLDELSTEPAGTHIGQLAASWLRGDLPEQFLMKYDYNFMFKMKCNLQKMRAHAGGGFSMEAQSVMEELMVYLCSLDAAAVLELGVDQPGETEDNEEWVFELFGDMDIITFLYSDIYLSEDHPYHFLHWDERCFGRR